MKFRSGDARVLFGRVPNVVQASVDVAEVDAPLVVEADVDDPVFVEDADVDREGVVAAGDWVILPGPNTMA